MNNDSRKTLWLDRLNSSWIDGDIITTHQQDKTADLVNNELKVCFELKPDQSYTPPNPGTSQLNNLNELSNRLKGYAESANKKFRNYPNFKTALIIETHLRKNIIKHLISNLTQVIVTSDRITVRRRNVYFSQDAKEIGGYLFCSSAEDKTYYFVNPYGTKEHVLQYKELLKLLPPDLPTEEVKFE